MLYLVKKDVAFIYFAVGVMWALKGIYCLQLEKRLFDVFILAAAIVVAGYGVAYYFTGDLSFIAPNLITIGTLAFVYPINLWFKINVLGYEAVEAKCVEVDAHRSISLGYKSLIYEGETIKRPTFSYEYKNERYVVSCELYTWLGVPEKGEFVTVYVNPLKPEKYVRVSKPSIIISIVMWCIFLLAGIPIAIFT
jgi:hypothetical protein